MAGLQDLLLAINEQVQSDELTALAGSSGLKEISIEDDTLTKVKDHYKGLMSIDAAKNNPDIIESIKETLKPQIKKSVLSNIDSQLLQTSRDLFGDEITSELSGIENSYERIKKFGEHSKKYIADHSSDDKLKGIIEGQKQQMDDLSKNFQSELKKKEKEIEKINTGFNNRLIQKEFTGILANYNLGDKYQEDFVKKALFSDVFSKVQQKAKLTLSDEGSIIPKNPENPELELFIDNKKVDSLKELLDVEMQPFIKKSGGLGVKPLEFKSRDTGAKISSLGADLMKRRDQANII